MNDSITSEVGLPPQSVLSENEMWRSIIEAQNKNIVALIEQLTQNKSDSEIKNVTLPKFNAETANSNVIAWCSTVDLIMSECKMEGSVLIIALSKSMQGSASQWLSEISFPGMTWENFRELIVQRYGGVETTAATIANVFNSRPVDNECLSVYGSRMVTTLMAKLQKANVEEVAVSIVLAHVAQINNGLQRLLFTKDIKTRNELQQELKAHAFEKKNEYRAIGGPSENKRMKLSTNVKCHFCGKLGHKIIDCRARKASFPGANSDVKAKSPLTCYKCGTVGHIASNCNTRDAVTSMKEKIVEKQVHLCEVVGPRGVLETSGESFQFYFDSGSECSIVKRSVSTKFFGNTFDNCVALKGIGNAIVFSNVQKLIKVVINGFLLEVLFHEISDEFLKHDIVIGQDILSMGYGVSITSDSLVIYKIKTFNTCSSLPSCRFENIDTDMIGEHKTRPIELIKKYNNWVASGFPMSRVKTGLFQIRLTDPNKIVQRRPYRLSIEERIIVRDRISELLDAGIIRPSCSPFASPIILVKKKNGADRLCVDYRELNSNTVSDKFPLPLISDQISRLRGAFYFSCLDMASGFHQIPVHQDAIEKTAFVTPDGQYEFLAMPFGLKNAPSCFQRTIVEALGELTYSFVLVYMDDVMIVATNLKEAIERLKIVLDKLQDAGFSLNFEKCSLLKTKVNYLGYEVESGVIRPNARKISALTNLPPPTTVTQLRQFIGLASYFRQFVQNFSQIMKPLYFLTSEKTLHWKPEYESVRQKIVAILTSEPVLVMFDPQYAIELHTDASSEGYGAILLHRINTKSHVIEYFSKTTSPAESRYHSYELETLAVVNAVKHFRHYLVGRHFTVVTDCNSIKASRTKKDLTPRVHRWWVFLQTFEFDVQYREGKRMAHVDFLSRNSLPEQTKPSVKVVQKKINLAEISNDWLLAEQQKDQETMSIISKIQNDELPESNSKTYELRKGILHRIIQRKVKTRCLPVVPRPFRWSVINHIHESIMHLGWEKTLDKVYQYYWFEHMSKYVRKFVDNCITCKLSKPVSGKLPIELHPIPKVSIPWHTIHVDLTGKLSGKNDIKEYVIVQIDAFTKFVLLSHTININSESCIKAMKNSMSLFGVPNRIIADQGRCFSSKDFREFCRSQNVDLHLIATGASRANGQVERVMSTLKSLLTAVETSNRSWQDALGEVQLALNSTVNRTTNASPLELMIGKEARPFGLLALENSELELDRPQLREEASKNISRAAAYNKSRFDKTKAKVIRYEVGDYVLLRNEERHQTKLDPKFRGPFRVAEVLDGDRYVLKQMSGNRTYKYAHEDLRKLPDGQGLENEDNM